MVEPQNYVQSLILRVARLGAEKAAKTLIVSCAPALKEMIKQVAYLNLHEQVEFIEATNADMNGQSVLAVEPQFHAVLIAASNAQTMLKIGSICSAYQSAGVPVVVVTGWMPPLDCDQFRIEASRPGNRTIAAMFDLAAQYCKAGITGDILEFGTFQGYTLQCAYHAFNEYSSAKKRRFIAFDSFAGVMGRKDGEGFYDGAYATSETSFRFSNFLAGIQDDQVTAVSGPYAETLLKDLNQTRQRLEPIEAALVHIDCDVEVPAKLALDFVTPYLKQGSLLLFDEYDLHKADNSKGERRALRNWLSENSNFEVEPYRTYHVHARSFIVHKR